ncbi:MAG: hypothetical protein JWP97_3192 [Labilithrix sp.]|nr:hypothetical protein [Labilithrix sp.]
MTPEPESKTPAKPASPAAAPPRTQTQVDIDRSEGEGMGLGALQPPAEETPSDEQPAKTENQ